MEIEYENDGYEKPLIHLIRKVGEVWCRRKSVFLDEISTDLIGKVTCNSCMSAYKRYHKKRDHINKMRLKMGWEPLDGK
jgi:hypothetical protein